MVFHVFVEGVTESAPDAARVLSEAMAARYGLPAADLHRRLVRGPFRVKANVDQATAAAYARDLEAIGARVRIEPASRPTRSLLPMPVDAPAAPAVASAAGEAGAPVPTPAQPEPRPSRPSRSGLSLEGEPRAPAPLVPSRPTRSSWPPTAAPRPSSPALPAQPVSRPSSPALPAQPVSRPSAPSLPAQPARATRSSLPPVDAARWSSAALPPRPASRSTRSSLSLSLPLPLPLPPEVSTFDRTPEPAPGAPTSLGALDGGVLTLASLGGDALSPGSIESRPNETLHGSIIGPDASRSPESSRRPRDEPLDLFAPPAEAEHALELADDELERRARKRRSDPSEAQAPGGRSPASAPLLSSVSTPVSASAQPLPALAQPLPASASASARPVSAQPVSAQPVSAQPVSASASASASAQPLSASASASAQPVSAQPLLAQPLLASAQPASPSASAQPASASPSRSLSASVLSLLSASVRSLSAPSPSAPSPAGARNPAPDLAAAARATASAPRPPGPASPAIAFGGAASGSAPGLASGSPAGSAAFAVSAAASASWPGRVRAGVTSRRGRFAAGVLLSVVLGFIPADIVATLREHSALRAIDARVIAAQDAADSPEGYAALDALRAEQLALKRSKRRMIALTSLVVWAAAAGAVGYVWFWRIRWERLAGAPAAPAPGPPPPRG